MHTIVSVHYPSLSVCDVAAHQHSFARAVLDITLGADATQMRSVPAPTLLPPPVSTDSRLIEPNEQWKADLRQRIEHSLRHIFEDARTARDTIPNSDSSESSHEPAQREYEESMKAVQTLAQEEFDRELRIEMSERECNGPRNPEGIVLSTTLQHQGESDSERGSDEVSEGGYGSSKLEDEEGQSGQSWDEDGGEDEGEEGEGGEREIKPRQSPPDVSLTQPFHSRSPIPAPLLQQQPSNFQPTEDHDDGGADESPVHAYLTRRRENQPYSHGEPSRRQSYGSQPPVWLPVPRSQNPSGVSGHANGQMYSTSLVQTPYWGGTSSTVSNNNNTGRHRAGSLDCDQYRSGSVTLHSGPGRRRGGSLNCDQHRSGSVAVHSDTDRRSGSLNPDQHRGGSVALHSGPGRRRGGSLNSDQHRSGSFTVHGDTSRRRSGSLNCDHHHGGSIALHSDPGRRRAGSLNCDQLCSGSFALHSGTEHPSLQARDRMTSDITARERQNSASASPHERPSSSHLTPPLRPLSNERAPPLDDVGHFSRSASASPHANPGSLTNSGMQRSSEDMRRDTVIPRRRTIPTEGSREASWSSHHPHPSFGGLHVHQRYNNKGDLPLITVDGDSSDVSENAIGLLHDRQSVHRTRSMNSMRGVELEQMAKYREAEVRRKEEEATRKEEEATKKEDEARRHEEKARLALGEAERLQVHARLADASVRIREATVQKRDAEVDLKELETKRREADVHQREVEVRRKEEDVTRREEDVRKMEEVARHMEDRAQQVLETVQRFESEVREAEASAKMREATAQKREAEAKRKRAKVKKHEAEVKNTEEQLREKERYLHIREAEIQKLLRAVNGRRETVNLQDGSLEQSLTALGEWEENVCLTESRLTQQMAIERQGNDAGREDDLVSLASTTRNSSKHDNTGPSCKDIASLKDPGNWTNEG